MPASSTTTSATYLNISASSALLIDCGSGDAAPMVLARSSSSRPTPSLSIGLLVPVPGEALDADLGDVAAEAAVPVEQRCPGARPRGAEGRAQATRPAADHEDIRLEDRRRPCAPPR